MWDLYADLYVVHVYVELTDPFVNLSIKNKSSKLLANIELWDNIMKVFYKTQWLSLIWDLDLIYVLSLQTAGELSSVGSQLTNVPSKYINNVWLTKHLKNYSKILFRVSDIKTTSRAKQFCF